MPIKTNVTLRKLDVSRAARLLVHWFDGDQLGINVVLADAANDPNGVPGLLFAVTHTAAMLAEDAAPDGTTAADNVRALLLDLQREADPS